MVQEGASQAASKKRKNRKGKKKTGGGQPQSEGQQGSTPPTPVTENAPKTPIVEHQAPVLTPHEAKPVKQEKKQMVPPKKESAPVKAEKQERERSNDLIKNLALELNENPCKYSNLTEIRDAEKLYYQFLSSKSKVPASATAHANTQTHVSKNPPKRTSPKKETSSSSDEITTPETKSNLAAEIAKAREYIRNSLECVDGIAAMASGTTQLVNKINALEVENKSLKKVTTDLQNLVLTLEKRVASLESKSAAPAPAANNAKPATHDDEDDDIDLFGSDEEEEDEEAARVREERLKAYAEKKAKKPALIAKTSVLLDVKPWDDETDMKAMEASVRTIEKEGLVWGASKLMPVGYGINKLQIMCVVEDEKVSIDELCEQIQEFEDFVQSVDIAAMSKI